ncbi:MAG: hypothetical protein AAF363_09760 [Bacteroidota bacterium]
MKISQLSEAERKVIIIGFISIVVAIICFGILNSTGTFNNEVYNLGGSIVGFLISAVTLNKIYGKTDIGIPKNEMRSTDFWSEDSVKVINLKNRIQISEHEANLKSKVLETDIYNMNRFSNENEIVFKYATTGLEVKGRSVSHPKNSEWIDTTQNHTSPGKDSHLKKRYKLKIDLSNLAKGQTTFIQNNIEFINGFQGLEKEWFHTHIDYPTKHLTMVLLFPPDKPCKKIVGKREVGRHDFEILASNQPLIIQDGQIAYWKLKNPNLGMAYQFEWEW